jgi:hypothetical protein
LKLVLFRFGRLVVQTLLGVAIQFVGETIENCEIASFTLSFDPIVYRERCLPARRSIPVSTSGESVTDVFSFIPPSYHYSQYHGFHRHVRQF